MLNTLSAPEVIKTKARHIAFIHVVVPRPIIDNKLPANTEDMKQAIHGGLTEILAILKTQNIDVIGPWFAHHLRKPTDTFEFEISIPVSSAVTPAGRVQASISSILDAVQTIYTGPYEGLPEAWHKLLDWMESNKYEPAEHFYEIYSKGPMDVSESAKFETELICPLAKGCYVS